MFVKTGYETTQVSFMGYKSSSNALQHMICTGAWKKWTDYLIKYIFKKILLKYFIIIIMRGAGAYCFTAAHHQRVIKMFSYPSLTAAYGINILTVYER